MNLQATIEIHGGGPGSGCNPNVGKCGRRSTGKSKSVLDVITPKPDTSGSYESTLSPKYQKIVKEFKDEVARQGYDVSKVKVVPESEQYDPEFGQASVAQINTRTGELEFSPTVDTHGMSIKGIVAHELMHWRLQKFIEEHPDELPSGWGQNIRMDDNTDVAKMMRRDGLTAYSHEVWN